MKQPTINLQSKRVMQHKVSKSELRYYKNVGLGFKTPKEAINGT
jgi:small subunit ribosomal protein S11e